ncbi:MAG: hypothetical protein O3C38_06300 [Proteobacteria bacterium]|nr:hypothetical protein [Pseudomonadota bacterium]MDA1037752.1 hypothetical protein [Pseudomonadota bacterium]
MKKLLLSILIIPAFISAEPWVDYELSEEVIEMTVVTVKPGMKDDYLMGIKRTWVDACNIQKELGHILGCGVYTANTAGTDPNVFLTIRYENLAAMGPNKQKYNEFTEAWRKKISESEQETIAGGYDDMREIVDLVVLQEVTFK